uniref:Uncharacterized protein n=1 Tax=Heterorhabditis bacteriophora TaxID=37862 RepID=A0A1I7X9I7_HETBA
MDLHLPNSNVDGLAELVYYDTFRLMNLWRKSTEATPRLKKAPKNREKNSPINLQCQKSFKLTVQMLRNLPMARLSPSSYFRLTVVAGPGHPLDEFDNKEFAQTEVASGNGAEPILRSNFPVHMTYTTRPSQYFSSKIEER